MAQVVCRNCNFKGNVSLSRKKFKWSRIHHVLKKAFLLAKPVAEKGKPATAVPCPKRKRHNLRRFEKKIKLVMRHGIAGQVYEL